MCGDAREGDRGRQREERGWEVVFKRLRPKGEQKSLKDKE